MPKGLLLVMMEPPATLEEEFHDWYDSEHFPQRCGLPGFESGSRWVCLSGWPRWLAIYDLTSVAALETAEYRAVSGPNSTPWSRRILPRTIGRQRVVAEQLHPGQAAALPPSEVASLAVARFAARPDPTRLEGIAGAHGLRQLRLFASGTEFWLLAAFATPLSADAAAGLFTGTAAGPDLLNLYRPYRRQ